jgi:hypothetical protein
MKASDFYSLSEDGKKVQIKKRIPFYEQLSEIFDESKVNDKNEMMATLPLHLSCTIMFAEMFLRENYDEILESRENIADIVQLKNKIVANFEEDDDYHNFLKIAVLFHDIGKFIEFDNHPQVGLYILRDFNPSEKTSLIDKITNEYFALLCSVVQHHDKFGVVQTGEASLSIFADIPYYASNYKTIKGVKKNFSYVCLCNLLDIASSIPTKVPVHDRKPIGLTVETIKRISDDWDELQNAISISEGEREKLKEVLLDKDRKTYRAIERLTRLLKSSSAPYPKISEAINNTVVDNNVPRALQCGMPEFAEGLAHITKLDYGLRFFRLLVTGICKKNLPKDSLIGVPEEGGENAIGKLVDKMSNSQVESICEEIIIKIVKILERFVLRYRWILKGEDEKSGRRIGFEMRGVLGNEKLTSAIIESLISVKREPAALNWITDKSPIWSFD